VTALGGARIGPELFAFLRDLREHNDRAWFAANRERYEAHVLDPLLQLIADFAPRLREISPEFVADPRPAGGSLFRLYRDTRFSRDKTPYKTNAGVQFRHAAGRDVHAPGFYLHLEPDAVFAAAGLWHPGPTELGRVRDAIVARPDEWGRLVAAPAAGPVLSQAGERLVRPPRGYDPDHPFVDDLKRKDFLVTAAFAEAEACRPDFLARYARTCRAAAPFVRFLTEAVGLPW
jgi:uncharacterized protein (TIGR02453 family)